VRSQILTALMGEQRPFQKKYFGLSLGVCFNAFDIDEMNASRRIGGGGRS
jgi:hypothetical protein